MALTSAARIETFTRCPTQQLTQGRHIRVHLLRVCSDPNEDRRRRLGCAGRFAAGLQSVRQAGLSAGDARLGSAIEATGWAPHFLLLESEGAFARGLPALPQGPLVRRVRIRLGLGRRLPAARARLLPQAARRRPVHAGSRAPVAGPDRCASAAAAARHRAARPLGRAVVRPPSFSRRRRPGRGSRSRLVDAQHRAIPLAQPRPAPPTPTSPTSWPACNATNARRSSRSGAASPKQE